MQNFLTQLIGEKMDYGKTLATGLVLFSLGVMGCGSGTMSQAESDAREGLRAMGAMTVLDIDQVHVGTVSLVVPTAQDKMDEAVPLLAKTPYITHLDVSGTNLSDDHMKTLGGLGKLRSLVLSNTGITDAGLKDIKGLDLDTLYVNGTGLTAESASVIAAMSKLKILEISGDLTADLAALKELPELEWLILDDARLESDDVDVLKSLAALGRLSLNSCELAPGDLEALKTAKPNLAIDVKSGDAAVEPSEEAASQDGATAEAASSEAE